MDESKSSTDGVSFHWRSIPARDAQLAPDGLIHALFEQQVERTPDVTAVTHDDQSLTYAELNCRANQLARYLREKGVGADQLVGICVERSLEMIVGCWRY
jgi:non-ribosomal peptide synthetase component F